MEFLNQPAFRKAAFSPVAEKLVVLKGHDFSRAISAAKTTGPSGPDGCFSGVLHEIQTLFRNLFRCEVSGGCPFDLSERSWL
jgi:hypothetical protein